MLEKNIPDSVLKEVKQGWNSLNEGKEEEILTRTNDYFYSISNE
jgi:hypothetical protein